MCYLENFRLFAAFGVQSNTFSLTYANFFMENCPIIAHLTTICAQKYRFLCVQHTINLQIIKKICSFSWSIEKVSVALHNQISRTL